MQWELKVKDQIDQKWKTIESGPPSNTNYEDNARYTGGYCLAPGRYAVIFYDLFEDGMCCTFGEGEYAGYVDGKKQFSSPTDAGKWKQQTYQFTMYAMS